MNNVQKMKAAFGVDRVGVTAIVLAILAFLLVMVLLALPSRAGAREDASIFLPAILTAQPDFGNADFEQGPVIWTEQATGNLDVIRNDQPVTAHSGSWVAWLGGALNNTSMIAQDVTVPPSAPVVAYYHYIASADVCGFDHAFVFANLTQVAEFDLCDDEDTHAWVKQTIDLSAFAGQMINFRVQVETDGSLNSNYFVDDFGFEGITAQAVDPPPGATAGSNDRAYKSGASDSSALIEQFRINK